MHPSIATLALRLAAPAAALAAAFAVAAAGPPASAAATAYLGLLAGLVLLAAGALDGRAGAAGAVVATAALWALPAGPARPAVVMAVAGGTLAAAAALGWAGRETVPRDGAERRSLDASFAVPAALGVQVLFQGRHLLAPAPSAGGTAALLVLFCLLPLAAALALLLLARRHGTLRAAVAGAVAVALAGGFTPAAVAALAALAAAPWAADRSTPLALRLAALAAMASPLAFGQRIGGLAVAAAAAVALGAATRSGPSARRWLALLPAAGAAAVAAAVPLAGAAEALAAAALVPLVVPAALGAAASRRPWAAAALVLAGAAALGAPPGAAAFAAPAALAALALPGRPSGENDEREGGGAGLLARVASPLRAVQGVWSAYLVAVAALAAAHPWLRARPVEAPLRLAGLPESWTGAAIAALAVAGTALATGTWIASGRRPRVAALATAGLLLVAAAVRLPAPGATAFAASGALLDLERPRWGASVARSGGVGVRSVVVDSSLANAAELEPGAPVATVELVGRRGERRSWLLRAGDATAEWTAGRAALGDPGAAPAAGARAWLAWVEPGGEFFGTRYRARRDWTGPFEVERVEVRRRPDLPPGVTLTLFRLELRR